MTQINPELASAAVFKTLFDNHYDIPEVICEFVLLHYLEWRTIEFTAKEMSVRLKSESGFSIPVAVIQDILINRGRKYFQYDKRSKKFSKSPDCPTETTDKLQALISEAKSKNQGVIRHIADYITDRTGQPLSDSEIAKIENTLNGYLCGKAKGDYVEYIAEYVVKQPEDSKEHIQLQKIKTGAIFMEGLAQQVHTKNIEDNFSVPLTIYLETEILFHIGGLHGEEYSGIGREFVETVKEINRLSKNGKPIVRLRYFPETRDVIEAYFKSAENIAERRTIEQSSGQAMKYIANKCHSRSDVRIFQERFFDRLEADGITMDSETNYKPSASIAQLNIEGLSEIERLEEEFDEKWSRSDIEDALKLVNYIHIKRKDMRRDRPILKIGHILITGKGVTYAVAKSVSHDKTVVPHNGAPLVCSIERISNLLWMTLNKRLRDGEAIPRSMNLTGHAQVFLAQRLESKINSMYKELELSQKAGKFDSEEAQIIAKELYLKEALPESMTSDNMESVSKFLSLKGLDDYREQLKTEHHEHRTLKDRVAELESESTETKSIAESRREENDRLRERLEREARDKEAMSAELAGLRAEKEEREARKELRQRRLAMLYKAFKWFSIALFVVAVGYGIYIVARHVMSDPVHSFMEDIWGVLLGMSPAVASWIYKKFPRA